MFTVGLYGLVIVLLMLSFRKDRWKTAAALKKAWRSFEGILPQFLCIILIIGVTLAVLSPEDISRLIGRESGWIGVIPAAIVGSITLIPPFVAFPLTAALLKSGAGIMQIAVFVSTLTMVGIVTFPMERNFFGRKAAILRNTLALCFSLLVGVVMEIVL
ncbi:MAG: permease [Deltaproteobacteria bacterium]|nr:permease [Deltaproteobacteria bacterium]